MTSLGVERTQVADSTAVQRSVKVASASITADVRRSGHAATFSGVTSGPVSADKRMRLRYAGACRLCGTPLGAGADAVYERGTKTVRCVECPEAEGGPEIDVSPVSGTAGGSARREYERRRERRRERIRAAHPKLGGLILALSDDPQSTLAWQQGAVGEELMATRLADLPGTFRVLHDRRIPGTRANIDHLAVGPSGVWVIDAKRYKGKRPELRVDGGFLRPRVESLRIGGRNGSKLVQGVRSQLALVTAVLDDATVPVTGVLCFLEADWPLLGGSFTVDSIHVTWPRALIKQMAGQLDAAGRVDVDAIHARLAAALPRA